MSDGDDRDLSQIGEIAGALAPRGQLFGGREASRDGACLHLRFVGTPTFATLAATEPSLILATIAVSNVKALFEEYQGREVAFPQHITKQAWGGTDFQVRDPDGNVLSFVQYG